MDQHPTSSHSNVKTYLLVFAGLAILTGLTVSLSYMGLSHGKGIFLAACIALTKCFLIATFFMHLKSEKRSIGAFFLIGVVFVIVLVAALIPDIGIVK
jgi:caa(3)-type oxidase subunit IV